MSTKNIGTLFLDNYNVLRSYAFKICKKEELSHDITQEVFLAIHSKYKNNDESINNKMAFLFQAIKFASYNELRKNHKNGYLKHDELSEDPLRNDFLLEELITKSIAEIPKQRRRVFLLKRINNFKVKEIADIMDIKPKTVENHITMAIRSLKREYRDYANYAS
ncbi:MAG: sigma-70 family RNA polymerase sigma factor [Bacteroidota bacterium]